MLVRIGEQPQVHLVGAGPGDPELLTLRAHRLLREADVVVYDRLVSTEVLDLIPTGTARIYVGKASGNHTLPQAEINTLLARLARAGRRVVRLKGGDPFLFGRGGEEAEDLARLGIRCEIVPGVTAATGCAAAAGIPLTHRGLATGVRFVTGHCRGEGALEFDWDGLVDTQTTLVVYMGLATLPELVQKLVEAGRAADTPVAAISHGTWESQRVCIASLATIADAVVDANLSTPVVFVIGEVVQMARILAPHDAIRDRDSDVSRHGT